MTSACGVIENIDYNDSKKDVTFRFENLNARGDVFEEYYYNTESLSIYKNKKNKKVYTVGDKISIKGETFGYPKDFDILILRDWIAIEIRNKVITNIKNIDEYNFKIEEKIFSGSIAEALKKFNIEYEVVDTTSMEIKRKSIAKKAFSIAKQVLDEAKKLPEYDDCYFLSEDLYKDKEYEEYNIDEFYTGIENEIYLIEYDITDFKNSNPDVKTARDHLHSDEFATVSNFIYTELKKRIESDKSINGIVDYYGDGDEGPYGLSLKK